MRKIDFNKNQPLLSIRPRREDGRLDVDNVSHISIEDGELVTEGPVGEGRYENFVELIHGLQGKGIAIDDFYF